MITLTVRTLYLSSRGRWFVLRYDPFIYSLSFKSHVGFKYDKQDQQVKAAFNKCLRLLKSWPKICCYRRLTTIGKNNTKKQQQKNTDNIDDCTY
jgi:hypothetical protein